MTMIKKVLVPIDFSQNSLAALDYAVELAKPFKAQLSLLFVVEPVYYATPTELYGPSGAQFSKLLEEQRESGRTQLARLGADLKKRRVHAHTILQTGTPYQVIVKVAQRLKVDLIVMATHGRTGLSHLLMGSVTERVVRSATCPVLTLRAAKGGKKSSRSGRGRKK